MVYAAVNLLKFSVDSIIEIANRRSFSSQIHFIQILQRELEITPGKYRKKYGRKKWMVGR